MEESQISFKEALVKNLPFITQYQITLFETIKLINNINKYLPLIILNKLPFEILNLIKNYFSNILNRNIDPSIFYKQTQMIGGFNSKYNYIYDIYRQKKYRINSKRGTKILKRYIFKYILEYT
jgi:hypothetical protein